MRHDFRRLIRVLFLLLLLMFLWCTVVFAYLYYTCLIESNIIMSRIKYVPLLHKQTCLKETSQVHTNVYEKMYSNALACEHAHRLIHIRCIFMTLTACFCKNRARPLYLGFISSLPFKFNGALSWEILLCKTPALFASPTLSSAIDCDSE